jgi:hypothetical protein
VKISDRLGHLSYSTLVHMGDTWPEMRQSLQTYVLQVKARVSPDAPFGVSLRLSGSSADSLVAEPAQIAWLQAFLAHNDLYVYTVNAFPHGPFKGQAVLENVYEPDWSTEERFRYTSNVARILSQICPVGIDPTIQTVPLAYKGKVAGPEYIARFTDNILRVVAVLVGLERSTGLRIKLAIEPEPYCYLETIDETIEYFESWLFAGAAAKRVADLARIPLSESHGALRRHLGIVFDICHQAVEFDEIPASLEALAQAGIPIFKLQQAAGLWVPEVTAETVEALGRFTETIYLSQTCERRDGKIIRYLNLADAIEAWRSDPAPGTREWRTHFHVPVFLDDLGPFRTTRFAIGEALKVHARTPVSTHLEIETYTWDVLPEELKTGEIVDYVVREIEYVIGEVTK